MITGDHGCCLVAIPHPSQVEEDGDVWTCDNCGTRWVWMILNGAGSWYRSKIAGLKRAEVSL